MEVQNQNDPETKVQIEITPQQICDLFITAVEGGSTYWCVKMRFYQNAAEVSYQEASSFEGHSWCVEVWTDDHGEGEDHHTIILDDFLRACEALPSRFLHLINEDYDAEDADCLVQQAAFGDIVYG